MTTRHRKKNKKELHEALKKKNEEFFARTGKIIVETGRNKHAENIAERRDYRSLERRHDGAAMHATRLWPNVPLRPNLANRPRV